MLCQRESACGDALGQGGTFHQLHHQVVGTDIVEVADVRVIQRRDCMDLTLEAVAEALGGDLDRYFTPDARIANPAPRLRDTKRFAKLFDVATIRDVASEVGVSVTTVSHALSGKRPVSRQMRRRIRETADRLGYRPNRIAAAMTTGKTHTLGMVVPDIANPFFGELLASAERAAGERGYTVIGCSSELDSTRETRDVRALLDRRVDGLIYLASSAGANPALDEVEQARVPIVALDEEMSSLPNTALVVTVDNEQGGALAAGHLLELGHEEIAVVAGPRGLPTASARLAGFVEALAQAGYRLLRSRIVRADAYRMSSGRKAGAALLEGREVQLFGSMATTRLVVTSPDASPPRTMMRLPFSTATARETGSASRPTL